MVVISMSAGLLGPFSFNDVNPVCEFTSKLTNHWRMEVQKKLLKKGKSTLKHLIKISNLIYYTLHSEFELINNAAIKVVSLT